MNLRPHLKHMLALAAVTGFVGSAQPSNQIIAQATDEFATTVRPILANKCFRCHGPDAGTRKGGLRLDLRDSAIRPAKSGRAAVVPRSPDRSELIRRIRSPDASERMPPLESKLSLSENEQTALERWIENGAPYGHHWAFQQLTRPKLPTASKTCRDPVDTFVHRRLRRENLRSSEEADRFRLLRRVHLDTIGLPPTPEAADEFAQESRPDAFERVLDRLLATPSFGERMAWDWLDVARYADSNGYQGDRERTMWPWRDWVVRSFNRNQPYDDFTRWQLAGDLIPDRTDEQRLATGFCRNHMINGEGGRIAEENRVDYVMDMTETTATVWLGLTMNCCRCHDHKFDPLKRRDYYSLFAFFNQTPVDGGGGDPQTAPTLAVPSEEQEERRRHLEASRDAHAADVATTERAILNQLRGAKGDSETGTTAPSGDASTAAAGENGSKESPASINAENTEAENTETAPTKIPKEIRDILARAAAERKPDQLKKLEGHWKDSNAPYVKTLEQLRGTIEELDRLRRSLPRVMVMADREKPRQTFMLDTGLYNKRQDVVTAAVPASLPPLAEEAARNRLGLANWLLEDNNPLTARVTVNRFWQQVFGTGLVKTSEDFGTQGELPSHPELLDWLASEFRDSRWDVKSLLRRILSSSTYRQTSRLTPELLERDPENRWLARGSRYRLPSWMLRDQALACSDLLVEHIGGRPVHPYQPPGIWKETSFGRKTYHQDSGENLYRRSLYTFWRRIVGPTMFFDSAARQICTVKQSRTNTPLHALTTLNDITYVEAARNLAARALGERALKDGDGARGTNGTRDAPSSLRGETVGDIIRDCFRRVLIRPPSDEELAILTQRFQALLQHYEGDPAAAKALLSVGESAYDEFLKPAALASLTAVCNVILNLDEALTKE